VIAFFFSVLGPLYLCVEVTVTFDPTQATCENAPVVAPHPMRPEWAVIRPPFMLIDAPDFNLIAENGFEH
jgi:hypothetical protein